MLEFGAPHMIANRGYIVHHAAAAGDRTAGMDKITASFFNPELIRRNFKKYGKRYSKLWITWGELGTLLSLLQSGNNLVNIISGQREAKRQLRSIDFS
jgi:hypothetical protein